MPFNIPSPSIGDVFRSHHPFYVPKYQRGYAWEMEELADFINDIKQLRAQPDKTEPHFLGGMVQVHLPAANIVSRKHEVVDGQQRMATFSLAMSAVLIGLKNLSAASADVAIKERCRAYTDEIQEAFLLYKDMQDGTRLDVPKLKLSRIDEPFFQNLISGAKPRPTRESHNRLQLASDAIYRDLIQPILDDACSEIDKLQGFIDLYRTISESCIVIHIVSQNRREAYRLFSVMNDRGRNLTDGDLLRARTLELLEDFPVEQNQVEHLWDDILDGKPEDVDRYLKAYFPSKTGRRAPNKDLFDTYQQEFLQPYTATSVRDFVLSLAQEKPTFEAIRCGAWPFASPSNASAWDCDRLNRIVNILRHELAHPLLLSAVKLGEAKFVSVVRLLERFVFRYINIVGAHPSPLYKPYNAEAKAMRNRPRTYKLKSLQNVLSQLIANRAPDISFQDNLITSLVYSDNSVRNREIRHFLSTLESYRRWYERGGRGLPTPDKMAVFDVTAATIEHVYPRNALRVNVDPAMEPRKDQISNLTILGENDNSDLGNEIFANKRAEYAKSSVGLTQRLTLFTNWTETELDTRERELLQMAIAVFSI